MIIISAMFEQTCINPVFFFHFTTDSGDRTGLFKLVYMYVCICVCTKYVCIYVRMNVLYMNVVKPI